MSNQAGERVQMTAAQEKGCILLSSYIRLTVDVHSSLPMRPKKTEDWFHEEVA